MSASTPLRSEALEYACLVQSLATKDPSLMPVAVRASLLDEYVKEGCRLYRSRTAGQVHGDGWKLDFGILDAEGLLTLTWGDVARLPKKERERLASHVVIPPVNARFLKMRLGMGACTDEGEIRAWDGRLDESAV